MKCTTRTDIIKTFAIAGATTAAIFRRETAELRNVLPRLRAAGENLFAHCTFVLNRAAAILLKSDLRSEYKTRAKTRPCFLIFGNYRFANVNPFYRRRKFFKPCHIKLDRRISASACRKNGVKPFKRLV